MSKLLTIELDTMQRVIKTCISLGQAKPDSDTNYLANKAYKMFLQNVKEV